MLDCSDLRPPAVELRIHSHNMLAAHERIRRCVVLFAVAGSGCSASADIEGPERHGYSCGNALGCESACELGTSGCTQTPSSGGGSGSMGVSGSANIGSGGSAGPAASTGGAGASVSTGFGGFASGGYVATGGAAVTGGAAQSAAGRGTSVPRGGSAQSGELPPPSPGPSAPVIPPVSGDCPVFTNGTISFMGLTGIQIVAGAKPPAATAPMLFYWHGTGGVSSEFERLAVAIAEGVEQQGGVLVSFQNTTAGDLYSGTLIFGESDLTIADQLVACAVRDANVDPRRIYTTGCSAGGLFATAMAALRSSYVAAAAPNSGGYVIQPPFDSDHTPPLMTVHGAPGADVVIVDFSQTSASADGYFKARGGFVINCNTGGGHCGGAALAGDMWAFFEAHPFGVSPEPWSSGLPSSFPSQCTIH